MPSALAMYSFEVPGAIWFIKKRPFLSAEAEGVAEERLATELLVGIVPPGK